jgi:manganese-dependent inorganic pyrophosphatase
VEEIAVTSYENPDVDGTACAYAYVELLRKKGKNAKLVIFGVPHREAQFVIKKFGIQLGRKMGVLGNSDSVILVDASDLKGISNDIDKDKVIEIIDHREVNQADLFKNAKVQIEMVGAAATLIAEEFMKDNIEPSRESACLMCSAIMSNTLNFKANVTTGRDRKAFDWLNRIAKLPEGYVKEMFGYKSDFGDKRIDEIMMDNFSSPKIGGKKFVIPQLEVIELDKLLERELGGIKNFLSRIKEKTGLDYAFLTSIDLDDGFNKFVAVDEKTKSLLERALGINFEGDVAKRDGVLLRKEIIPILKAYLET